MSEHKAKEICCDDCAGYGLRIIHAMDGDFHISVILVPEPDESRAEFTDRITSRATGSVRLRMPMIGGGAQDALYAALAKAWPKLNENVARHFERIRATPNHEEHDE